MSRYYQKKYGIFDPDFINADINDKINELKKINIKVISYELDLDDEEFELSDQRSSIFIAKIYIGNTDIKFINKLVGFNDDWTLICN